MNLTKTMIVTLALAFSATILPAQKKEKEVKYERLFYKDFTKETGEVTITVDNAVSTDGETKFKLKITNKTTSFLIYKPEESKLVVNGKEMKVKEKMLIIKPNSSDFRVINVKGDHFNSIKSYSFLVDGLYTVSPDSKGVDAPDFKLPPSANEFKAGAFSCAMSKLYKETDQTDVKFKCSYNGDKIGFIDPSKAAVKMPDGNEYAAVKSSGLFGGSGPVMIMKGETESFNVKWDRMEGGKKMDMQKVEMTVLWRNTFSESVPVKTKPETLNFEFDEFVSNEKAK